MGRVFGDRRFGSGFGSGFLRAAANRSRIQAAEVAEFGHGQVRTADSLLATIGTHSHLLVMDEAERVALLAGVDDFLRRQPETARGEFTLPMVTVVLRARRR